MNSSPQYRCGPCCNCGKPEGGFLGSTAWGHNYPCCSEACGKRLGQKLRNGMLGNPVYQRWSPVFLNANLEEIPDKRIQDLRNEIKKLRHRLKQ